MASIPLPALHINPPAPPENPLDQYARLMQLKNQQQMAPLQQQLAQQQVQAGALENQKAQLQMKDQQAMTAAMQQWSQKASTPAASTAPGMTGGPPAPAAPSMPDYDNLIDLAKKHGASFSAIQGLQKSVLDMKEKAATIAKDDAQTGTDNANALKTKNGMLIDAMTGVMNLPDDQLAPGLLSAAQELAGKGLLDPPHMQMAQQLAQSGDPAAIRKTLTAQIAGMGGFSKLLDEAQKQAELKKTQGASDPNSPFYAPSAASVALGTAPGAAQIQAGEVKQAAKKASAEAAARQPYEMSLARQRQALSQGDPNAAGQLLVSGDATLSELKSRGATPDFIARALFAAKQQSGGKYNAAAADAQFSTAKSEDNVKFFGSAKSLTDKGGTLDQLAETAKKIPQNQFPVLNSLEDWTKEAAGSGPLAEYAARVLGVADDYAKVMGGGSGSDTSRLQAANLISKKLSAEGREGAINGIRGSVNSQMTSRIGKNPYLARMYGDAAPTAGTQSSDPFAQFGGKAH